MRRTLVPFASVALLVFWSQSAFAYVLPSDFLLRMLADKRKGVTMKDATLNLTAELDGNDAPIDERLYLKTPERSRLVQNTDDVPTVSIEKEGKRARGPENKLAKDTSPNVDILPVLLMPAGDEIDAMSSRMIAAVKGLGIDMKTTAFGRTGDTVAYIIGARAWEPDKPQLWLYKNTFLPARLVVIGSDKARYETRWLDYGGQVTGDYYPQIIETYKNGKLIRRAEVQKIQVNQNLPESLFELPRA